MLARDEGFRVLVSVLEAIHAESTFEGALDATLRSLLAHTSWVLGEAWVPDRDHSLRLAASRTSVEADSARLAGFMAASARSSFARGSGLPGRVLASAKFEWIQDVADLGTERYLRAQLARDAGLHAALAVPVLAANEVFAVLVFYMGEPQPEDEPRVALVAAAARELGTALRRVRDHELRARLQEKIETLATPILEIAEYVALVPVVGDLDAEMGRLLTERVLAYVEKRRLRVVIIDLTGVQSLDSANTKGLIDLSRACSLLGTCAVVTGVRAPFARMLVRLGISADALRTEASLANGLQTAMTIASSPIEKRMRTTR
ncbi:MAG: STAS domain-containing protein [Polyangiales bacterium]